MIVGSSRIVLGGKDGNCFLANRDMQEAGELARAKALLHLLLEAANEQHLAQEILQALAARDLFPFFQPGHARTAYRHSTRLAGGETRRAMA